MRRNWELANRLKRGPCRVCGDTRNVELAHTLGRSYDVATIGGRTAVVSTVVVHPDSVVPLCGPAVNTGTCHGEYDAHRLDLWPHLTQQERDWAVRRAGYGQARRRISGRAWLGIAVGASGTIER